MSPLCWACLCDMKEQFLKSERCCKHYAEAWKCTEMHSKPTLVAAWNITTLAGLLCTLSQQAAAWPIASAAECATLTGKDRGLGNCVMCLNRRHAGRRK